MRGAVVTALNPSTQILGRLRRESARCPITDDSLQVAASVGKLALGELDLARGARPSEVLRAAAVALAATRQSFLTGRYLTDASLAQSLPILRHVSATAEGLVRLADDLAAEELACGDQAPTTA